MAVRVRCVACGKEQTVWDDQAPPEKCRVCGGEMAMLDGVSVPSRGALTWMIVACAVLAVAVMWQEIRGLCGKLADLAAGFFHSGW